MIVAAVVCPHPPLLFRELAGQQDAAAEIRRACVAAVRDAVGDGVDSVVVVGGDDATRTWDPELPEPVDGFGSPGGRTRARPAGTPLPLSLGVGTRLLVEAGWQGPGELLAIGWEAPLPEAADLASQVNSRTSRVALLVLGDGSARRGATAPGYVDERAVPFDDALAGALATADLHALLDIDAALARELMAGGRAAFQVLAAAMDWQGTAVEASLRYRDDPFGVTYVVALWRCLLR